MAKFQKEDWVLVYDTKSTISGGGGHVLKSREDSRGGGKSYALIGKLAFNWTGPYKAIAVGPEKTSDGVEVGKNVLLLEVGKDDLGKGISPRVSVHRCKRCYNPHEKVDMPRFLPWNLCKYLYVFRVGTAVASHG